jgi:hypothetical protein
LNNEINNEKNNSSNINDNNILKSQKKRRWKSKRIYKFCWRTKNGKR